MNNKALIAMSGGVDSTVAALIMKERGYDCSGATMKLFDKDDIGASGESRCCSLDDILDARYAAELIGIPYYVFNFREEFKQQVIKKFAETYRSGGTPNPCIDCNRFLKFDRFLRRAEEMSIDTMATGHYARIEKNGDRCILRRGIDAAKDQSYVLYGMTQYQLRHTEFPLGGMTKNEVREIAERHGFMNAKKRESQDICFVPDGKYAEFIERNTGEKSVPGDFVTEDGRVIGKHKGIEHYTVGQRKHLGIALREPLFVCGKRAEDNSIVLGGEEQLYTKTIYANDINLIVCDEIGGSLRLTVKTRYRQKEQPAIVTQTGNSEIRIDFAEPLRAPAIGQAAVLYDEDIVVGGGTICKTLQ